jgi:fatty acid desaturase
MAHILIGAVAAAGFFSLLHFCRIKSRKLPWWQWLLTLLAFIYSVFVLELVISFLSEGVVRGALIMGLMLGFIAVIWATLLGRFVFFRTKKTPAPAPERN